MTLLGPSRQLVERHRDKLSVSSALLFAFERFERVKTVTASNQLSYVMRFDAEGQGILVCGDAAFVDFKVRRGSPAVYHRKLVDQLRQLAIVQVPHHGGINGHFYRVLHASCFHGQKSQTFFLLSHEAQRRHRPSGGFADYVQRLGPGHPLRLLFTNKPMTSRVVDYSPSAHAAVPDDAEGGGDVRLAYQAGEWRVLDHRVRFG